MSSAPKDASGRSGRVGAGTTRAEAAARHILALAEGRGAGVRLGTKEELRAQCGVSVGTFNESLRLLQARGVITVRPGPGGGLFTAEQSPMVRLGNSVLALDAQQTDVAEAVRIRDALDPLLIEDALWHASPADIADLREKLADMRRAVETEDPVAFVHANWRLHARIAAISPNPLLRSLYSSLLDLIESHTLAVQPFGDRPLGEYIADRHRLHGALVDALDRRDRAEALRLVHAHNTSPEAADAPPARLPAQP
ncbi:FCD domain-containing protein [Actinacidiphila sp. DG2A-62]|uniref:FadR/GntR family transcriptional regulator n=1 Tax=Actinacidiphila sp. DG2A-62 TaxID=3108821 RepID=UPI002DBB19E5|nr:FCD domain-containing protein [Actinacidiphila sp. DG2A-62]MEC3993763.1 FCD domain-containing protein [Actinacidiphila sp. DG2A-62]